MDLRATLQDLENARLTLSIVETELVSEQDDPAIKQLVDNARATESAIMLKLIDGLIAELEEFGHADKRVAELVHEWLGITDVVGKTDEAKAYWLDNLGTVAGDIDKAHSEYQTLERLFASAKSNSKVHQLLTVKRLAATSLEKNLLPAYILALEAGGGSRATEIYDAAKDKMKQS